VHEGSVTRCVPAEDVAWEAKHEEYAAQDWIARPTYFAEEVVSRFPADARVLDRAAGRARTASTCPARGSTVTAVDFAQSALDRFPGHRPDGRPDQAPPVHCRLSVSVRRGHLRRRVLASEPALLQPRRHRGDLSPNFTASTASGRAAVPSWSTPSTIQSAVVVPVWTTTGTSWGPVSGSVFFSGPVCSTSPQARFHSIPAGTSRPHP